MTFDDVRVCLEGTGWPVEEVSSATIRSRFRGKSRVFHVFVHMGIEGRSTNPRENAGRSTNPGETAGRSTEAEFVTFAVIPYARLPEDEVLADALVTRLLRLNREMNMAKFSLDEESDIVLSVEHRMEDLDPSEVRDAVDQLSFYADKFAAEIDEVANAAPV
jgi:hypothetical protein